MGTGRKKNEKKGSWAVFFMVIGIDLYHVVPSGGAADVVDCHGAGDHPDQSDLLEKRAEQGRSEIDRG